jgi:hypothetical protein
MLPIVTPNVSEKPFHRPSTHHPLRDRRRRTDEPGLDDEARIEGDRRDACIRSLEATIQFIGIQDRAQL